MAKKKAAKKARSKKSVAKKKVATKKKAATRLTRKTKSKRPARKTLPPKSKNGPARRPTPQRKRSRGGQAVKPAEKLERKTVNIEEQRSGDLVVTEPGGGSIQVHHTVHPGAMTTPIPGTNYDELKKLGPGTHEIEVERSTGPASGGTMI
jgi:hypothetical protein